ncbi:MAG: 3-oxoacyl-ACP reductase FabG [Clostridiales bacterium]|nr:3-oxoacyl-ACP reductase FabG [Clostridiales bacterium]
MDLQNKVAIVTGGSRGIGLAVVEAFLKEGATVVLCGSRQETAEQAVEGIKKSDPKAKVSCIWPNLSDYESVKTSFDGVLKTYGRIDILVNNAGISENTPFLNYTEEVFDRVMDLNVKGVYNCSKAVADWMVKQKDGVILNVSSMVSRYGQPAGIAYPTSKFAVNGFTLSLARELAPKGVRVNAVAPGITETDMVKALPKQVIEPIINTIPLRRIGKPEDIANALVFLASDKANYITGVVLSVDGLART